MQEYEEIRKECEKEGCKVDDKEFGDLLSYARRKAGVLGKGESYISYLLPDVIREYIFRNTVNAISMAIMNVADI